MGKQNEAGGKMTKSTKIMIAVIAVLAAAIVALVVILVSGNKKKNETTTTETTEKTTTEAVATPADSDTSEDTSKETDCFVTLSNTNSWEANGGFAGQLDAKITNNSGKELKNWSIEIAAKDGTSVDSFWNCEAKLDGSKIIITPVEYNETVAASQTVGDIGIIVNVKNKGDLAELCNGAGLYVDGVLYAGSEAEATTEEEATEAGAITAPEAEEGTPFDNHGKLSVSGTDLVDKDNNKYQLKGVSTHGIAWFPDYVNKDAFATFRDDWGANIIRLAMYTGEDNGYCQGGDKECLKGLIDTGVNAATELGMYVIIDWHILSDNNPLTNKDEAISFFKEMSAKYKDYDNVIYEICNEPNGGTSWADVKSYAEEVIPVIRANASDAIIIVGTPNWSQDVDVASDDPITGYDNIMYAVHFYAATHTDSIRSKVETAISNGLPVFISEFSICDASGNGGIDYNQADLWFDLVKQHNLSYVGWNVSNKDETSSLISAACTKTSGWTEADLSETGKWLRNKILGN